VPDGQENLPSHDRHSTTQQPSLRKPKEILETNNINGRAPVIHQYSGKRLMSNQVSKRTRNEQAANASTES